MITETNAERLKHIKDKSGWGNLTFSDFRFLFKQAERAQELEWALNTQRMEYEKEISSLRKALMQIAVGDTWTAHPHDIAAWALGIEKGESE